MKKIILCITVLWLLAFPALAESFTLDEYAQVWGMDHSWYQGYEPEIRSHTMTLYLPLRSEACTGAITASIALDDPNVFLLTGQPRTVTVYPEDGVYPVKLTLNLERYRRDGDFSATVTLRGFDENGSEVVQTFPYVIRIRDGYRSHETLEPVITPVDSQLDVGCPGSLTLTIANPTSTISMTDAVLTVTDDAGDVLMSGSHRFPLAELLPGASETVTIPLTVDAAAKLRQHTLTVELQYSALGVDSTWKEELTLPVTQEIRLEQGGVQIPTSIAGELGSMTLPLMNLGKGELANVLVKLDAPEVLDAQSVLVGTIAPGETKQAKLTFTPWPDSAGTHPGAVTVSCEDAYGNAFTRTLDVTVTVEPPLPEVSEPAEETAKSTNWAVVVPMALCVLLALSLVVQGAVLTGKLHRLEEERL